MIMLVKNWQEKKFILPFQFTFSGCQYTDHTFSLKNPQKKAKKGSVNFYKATYQNSDYQFIISVLTLKKDGSFDPISQPEGGWDSTTPRILAAERAKNYVIWHIT